jgi:xanthine dehydrogenase accessory factor
MSQGDLVRRMEELLADRVPFVTATVVRAAKPTSVRPVDAAIVLADGHDRRLRGRRLRAGVRAPARRAGARDRRGRAAPALPGGRRG